jgi:hypothetical protein
MDSLTNRFNQHEDFTNKVNEYVKIHQPYIYLLAPCFGGTCFVNFAQGLIDTKELLTFFQIPLKIVFCKGYSLISRARNNLVAKAMNNPKMTHMIFIDNDITWSPVDVLKLLISDKDVIGGIYPLKHYNWERLLPTENNPDRIGTLLNKKRDSQLGQNLTDSEAIQNSLLKFNVNYLSREIDIHQNLTQVRHIATGFMMFKRNVITTMSNHYATTKYTDDVNFLEDDENAYAYALFDCGVVDDHYLSEDWMFCNRWTSIGGSIWVDVSIDLMHTGIEDYKGSYMASLI